MTPQPVMGALAVVQFGLITMAGVSTLSRCDLRSVRNMVIVGLGLMLGLMLPFYIRDNPTAVDTGELL